MTIPPGGRGKARGPNPTPLGLMVLSLLSERPMHPYEMQRLMIARGDDQVVRVQRGSLYPAVERLEAAGLVAREATVRAGRRPERTIYRITEEGERVARTWLLDMLAGYKNEYPQFGAAMSFVALVDSATASDALQVRRSHLARDVKAAEAILANLADGGLPRPFILEMEYTTTMKRAELAYVAGLLKDLSDGALAWDRDSITAWYQQVVADGRFPDAVSRPLDADPAEEDVEEPHRSP